VPQIYSFTQRFPYTSDGYGVKFFQSEGGPVPIINVLMFEGRTIDQKRKLVEKMTDAVVTSLDVKPEDVRILLQEMARHDYAIAGVLAMDKKG
jgi:4-oxalocrotonate tautomerase